jgi:hypothetical protein
MLADKDEDILRKAIKGFVQNGSPRNLKNALKVLQKEDDSIQETPSIFKKLDKEKVTEIE